MTTFETRTDIAAAPVKVWTRLLDLTTWTSWDPSLERVDGSLAPGGRVMIHVTDQPRPFKLRVVEHEPDRRLVLRGGMPLGLFHGTRRYVLEPLPDDRTAVTVHETYAGVLAPLITRAIPDLQPSFEAFVAGLRRDAERGPARVTEREDHR